MEAAGDFLLGADAEELKNCPPCLKPFTGTTARTVGRRGEVNRASYFFFVELLTAKTDVDEFAT